MTTWRPVRWAVVAVLFCVAAARPSIAQDAAPAAEARGETRTWTDITGKFSREAEFLKHEEGKVWLRLSSGKEISIPLKELSKKDRDWVRNNGAPKGAGGAKGVATRIVLRSYQAIVADSVALSQSLQQQALAGAIPGFFVGLTGGKPLEGFDIKRPIVVTIHVDGRGQHSATMVAVPVTAKETFQKTLDAVFPAKASPKGRAYEVAMLGKSVYAKPGEKYFLLSDSADIVRNAQADPEDPVAVADISAESYFAVMPEAERRRSVGELESMMETMRGGQPPVPPTVERFQKVFRESMSALTRMLLEDGDRSTFEASIDPATKQTSISFGLRAKSGTPLAEAFASYGALRPRFVASHGADETGWIGVSVPKNEWLQEAVKAVFGEGLAPLRQMIDARAGQPGHAEAKAALGELEGQIGSLVDATHFEQELVVTADASGAPRVVTRIGHDSAGKFLAALSKLTAIGAAPGVGVPDGDGILTIPLPSTGAEGLAAQPVRVAATSDAIVFGFGCADTAPVKAIGASASAGAASSAISARLDLARLWPTLAAMNEGTAALGGAVGEKGMVRADVNALADGIEVRLNVDDGVLALLGALGGAFSQMQGMPGGPGFPGAGEAGGLPPGFPPAGPPAGGPGSPAAGGVPKRRPGGPGLPGPDGAPPTIQGFPTPPIPQPNQPQAPAP